MLRLSFFRSSSYHKNNEDRYLFVLKRTFLKLKIRYWHYAMTFLSINAKLNIKTPRCPLKISVSQCGLLAFCCRHVMSMVRQPPPGLPMPRLHTPPSGLPLWLTRGLGGVKGRGIRLGGVIKTCEVELLSILYRYQCPTFLRDLTKTIPHPPTDTS